MAKIGRGRGRAMVAMLQGRLYRCDAGRGVFVSRIGRGRGREMVAI